MNRRVESVVRKLFADLKFREEAAKNPESALGTFELSTAERRSLVRLCRSMAPAGGPSSMQLTTEALVWV